MIFADEVQTFLPPARGRRALRAVLDALAGAEGRVLEPNYPAAMSYLAARNRRRALTVLFTDVIDRTASDALLVRTASLRPAAPAAGGHPAGPGARRAGGGPPGDGPGRRSSGPPRRNCCWRGKTRWPRCAAAA